MTSVDAIISGLLKGEPLALARAVTMVENSEAGASEILTAIEPTRGKSKVVGITGPPGAGKSTLIGALIGEIRRREKTACVLAIDPSSPLTGGAVLGDRIRMALHGQDPGIFIRSVAARGHLGGLTQTASAIVRVMEAFGPDFVIVETVGAGQSEVEITDIADGTVVVCPPGLGDDIQAIKAGILEIADILVVNKSDHVDSQSTVRHLEGMLSLRAHDKKRPPIIRTIATTGHGISSLADALDALALRRMNLPHTDRNLRLQQRIADAAARIVGMHIRTIRTPELNCLCERVEIGEINVETAAAELAQAWGFSTACEDRLASAPDK